MTHSTSSPLSSPLARRRALALGAALPFLTAGIPAAAQVGGSGLTGSSFAEGELEVLIKTTLLTFNDANLTGRYEVLHARLHPEFQKAYSPRALADGFKPFRDQRIDLGVIVLHKPVMSEGPGVDARGWLGLKGVFETRPSRVHFDLAFARDGQVWKAVTINVRVSAG
jgi:hypothetical protein